MGKINGQTEVQPGHPPPASSSEPVDAAATEGAAIKTETKLDSKEGVEKNAAATEKVGAVKGEVKEESAVADKKTEEAL